MFIEYVFGTLAAIAWLVVVASLASTISVLWPFPAPTPLSPHSRHNQRASPYAPHTSP